jgi:hypothetical protein
MHLANGSKTLTAKATKTAQQPHEHRVSALESVHQPLELIPEPATQNFNYF